MTKAFILAAGRGKRMRPITDHTPKALLKVNGKSLIIYHIEKLCAAGVTDIIINLDYLGEKIRHTLGNGHSMGVNIEYSIERRGALGTAGGIVHALPLLGEKPFIVINCDIWSNLYYKQLPKHITNLAHLIMVSNPKHHSQGDFSLANGRVIYNKNANQQYTYSGIGIYQRTFFKNCQEGYLPLGLLLKYGAEHGNISGEIFSGQWFDIGTPERLNALQKHLNVQD